MLLYTFLFLEGLGLNSASKILKYQKKRENPTTDPIFLGGGGGILAVARLFFMLSNI